MLKMLLHFKATKRKGEAVWKTGTGYMKGFIRAICIARILCAVPFAVRSAYLTTGKPAALGIAKAAGIFMMERKAFV